MKIPFSVTSKLLLFVLPLVCLPVAIVGYLSYHASVEWVTHLSRDQQMTQAKTSADRINSIFKSCRMDLETVTRLPAIEDYYYNIVYHLKAEAEDSRKKIIKLFRDFIARSPYYYQIRFLDENGIEIVRVCADGQEKQLSVQGPQAFFQDMRLMGEERLHISEITCSPSHQGFVVYFAKPFINIWGEFAGAVVIDLDYNKVIDVVKAIRVGEQGYAFLVDQLGRTIAHPQFKPYEYGLSKYPAPRLREFVINMMAGETGWKAYYYLGEKAAAYAPIPAMDWSLAVAIPIEEFKKEAQAIRVKVVQVVVATLLLAVVVVIVLSYNLLRPVRRLVAATERIASGDLSQEIAIKSGDELGALTRSFNRMVRNLKEIQSELVRSEKLISLGRLSAGVAHEIRNPLNAMKGAIVYLQRRKSHDTLIQEYTQLILEEIDRLNQFVTEFLYFARQSSPNLTPANLNELIWNTLNLFEEKFREKGINVVKHLDPSLPSLMIDPNQMEQVIVNLFINACDAMAEGGVLELSTEIKRDGQGADSSFRALVKVEDDGAGIPHEHLQNIFDPFFSTKETGTGLGLPISLGIVESHGGKLKVQSQESKGTKVIIELPVMENDMEQQVKSAKEENTGR
jgi:signal transduction histidine kinase